ncbi:PhyR family response regulator anti-anti-sigma factor [Vineibacter terrae]|uniref:PhyR family response regulator anti-anti-sigma factor n=1 Tax=Vineibacter terrae TaxID=2586908 RepID=UPI002E378647|nr:response regulator [Vineibacter terrae]HEX2888431.1 response regulator [Vineibacter terrae]
MSNTASELSRQLLDTLPFLRRYARALTGSQDKGDQWVRLCVEVLLQQPELMRDSTSTKVDVFALFHRLQRPFGGLDSDGGGDPGTAPGRLKAQIGEIPDVQRKVLLLTVLEGFAIGDAARILAITPAAAEEALRAAREELRRVASVRVLVIEDEAVIALDVAKIVRSAGHQVVGIAATEDAAVSLAAKHTPDLVIADIQLRGDDNGMAAVRQILKSMSVPIIFVTGYPERLLTGEGIEPAFVITKPFDPDLLKTAMAQALNIVAI